MSADWWLSVVFLAVASGALLMLVACVLYGVIRASIWLYECFRRWP